MRFRDSRSTKCGPGKQEVSGVIAMPLGFDLSHLAARKVLGFAYLHPKFAPRTVVDVACVELCHWITVVTEWSHCALVASRFAVDVLCILLSFDHILMNHMHHHTTSHDITSQNSTRRTGLVHKS